MCDKQAYEWSTTDDALLLKAVRKYRFPNRQSIRWHAVATLLKRAPDDCKMRHERLTAASPHPTTILALARQYPSQYTLIASLCGSTAAQCHEIICKAANNGHYLLNTDKLEPRPKRSVAECQLLYAMATERLSTIFNRKTLKKRREQIERSHLQNTPHK